MAAERAAVASCVGGETAPRMGLLSVRRRTYVESGDEGSTVDLGGVRRGHRTESISQSTEVMETLW